MNRRSFLRRLGAVAVALTLARHLPGIAPEPLALPMPQDDGISIRFIREFDVTGPVHRFDILYGFGTVQPNLAVRVQG